MDRVREIPKRAGPYTHFQYLKITNTYRMSESMW